MRARLIGRRIRFAVVLVNQTLGQQVSFHFIAADIRQHVPVDLNTGAEHLTASLDHFLTLSRVIDDVTVFVRQIVLAEHGADTLAPAAGGFQIGYNFRFSHKSDYLLTCHNLGKLPRPYSRISTIDFAWPRPTLAPLNVLIIPDKFKGTLSATAAARAIARGWRRARSKDHLQLRPMTDGGDGFGELMAKLMGARRQVTNVVDAAGRRCKTRWWYRPQNRTALIDSSGVIGLAMLPPGRFHPFKLDTFGLGLLLRAVADCGAERCLIGIGGSATNDAGFGMARALNWEFFDAAGRQITVWTDLGSLKRLRPPYPKSLFKEVVVAVDVANPLLGARGATRIYGPQKGLRPADFRTGEVSLQRLARVSARELGRDFAGVKGAGAAGGLGFGFMAFLGARLVPGFELFAARAGVEKLLRWADLVVTGEGALDRSTLMGKGVGNVAKRCRQLRIPCIGLGGSVSGVVTASKAFTYTGALTDLTAVQKAKTKPAFWLERAANLAAESW